MNNIKKLRKQNKMSQDQLAKILEVHRTTIVNWENDNTVPDAEKLTKLANLFQVNAESIFDNEEIVNKHFLTKEEYEELKKAKEILERIIK